jgi:hypothetical protein
MSVRQIHTGAASYEEPRDLIIQGLPNGESQLFLAALMGGKR